MSYIKGFSIPLFKKPVQTVKPVQQNWSPVEYDIIKKSVQELINKGAISQVDSCKDQYVSNIFIVPKPDGSHRLILNLKNFNKNVKTSHFKIEDYRTVARLITPNCLMATIDLQDAYYLIPIKKSHRKYLRFQFNNCLYEYNCLPFGLSCAPQIFTKILKPVMSLLRTQGFISVIYLDDIFLIGRTVSECQINVTETIKMLDSLGFLINLKKSCLTPSNVCKYLGFQYSSIDMSISLPMEKCGKVLRLVQKFSVLKKCKIREFSKFIGTLVSAAPAIKYGFLYTKLFEHEKYIALQKSNGNYNSNMFISPTLSYDFSWWTKHLMISTNAIRYDTFQIEIFTDASKSGWGAHSSNRTTFGFWSENEQNCHINELELLAVYLGLNCFASTLSNCNILVRVDNTTALCVINRMGSVRFQNLNKIARKIWNWCEERNNFIFASYINTTENVFADRASRQVHKETEWKLANYAFQHIIDVFGQPDIDLFASRLNKKCQKFISWLSDPEAYKIDAFTTDWSKYYFYAFPPFAMILRALQKIIKDRAEGILVVPLWTTQPWYPIFKALLIDRPIIFKPKSTLLTFRGVPHPLSKDLSLVAGKLSGKLYCREEYLKNH